MAKTEYWLHKPQPPFHFSLYEKKAWWVARKAGMWLSIRTKKGIRFWEFVDRESKRSILFYYTDTKRWHCPLNNTRGVREQTFGVVQFAEELKRYL